MVAGNLSMSRLLVWIVLTALNPEALVVLGARLREEDVDIEELRESGAGQGPSSLLTLAQTRLGDDVLAAEHVVAEAKRGRGQQDNSLTTAATRAENAAQRKAELLRKSRRALEEKRAEASRASAAAREAELQMEAILGSEPSGLEEDVALTPPASAATSLRQSSRHSASPRPLAPSPSSRIVEVNASPSDKASQKSRSSRLSAAASSLLDVSMPDDEMPAAAESADPSLEDISPVSDDNMEQTMLAVAHAKQEGSLLSSLRDDSESDTASAMKALQKESALELDDGGAEAELSRPSHLRNEQPVARHQQHRQTASALAEEGEDGGALAAVLARQQEERSVLALLKPTAAPGEEDEELEVALAKVAKPSARSGSENRQIHKFGSARQGKASSMGSGGLSDLASEVSDPWAASLAQKEGPDLKVAAAIVARKKVEKEIAQNELDLVTARKGVKLQSLVEAKAAAAVKESEKKLRAAVNANKVAQQEADDLANALNGAEEEKIKLEGSLQGGLLEQRLGVGQDAADLNLAALLMAKRKADKEATKTASLLESAKEALQRQTEVEEQAVVRVHEALRRVVTITTSNKIAHQEAQDLANTLYSAEAERAEAREDIMGAAGEHAAGLQAGLQKVSELDDLSSLLQASKAQLGD